MASISSSLNPFFGVKEEEQSQVNQNQSSSVANMTALLLETETSAAPVKKKRNQPGNPSPDAEIIALSPNSLLATNRYICEVCNKGFQREQNLQLHRRGHNLPWKLRQKSPTAVRRRVYLCPEPTCVHHDPSRALGDLTGIKKHFFRKHGEKKFKCEKCSKRYAVQSDWKAHSKTCGTREYRCDCGTLFSRRDSFITHRAFCDALAQETKFPTLGHNLYNNNIPMSFSQLNSSSSTNYQFNHLISHPNTTLRPPNYYNNNSNLNFNISHDQQHSLIQASAPTALNFNFFSNTTSSCSTDVTNNAGMMSDCDQSDNTNCTIDRMMMFPGNPRSDNNHLLSVFSSSNIHNTPAHHAPHFSATALLQKAAQMGSTTSDRSSSILQGFTNGSGSKEVAHHFYSTPSAHQMESENNLQSLMNSLANGNTSGLLGGMMTTFGDNKEDNGSFGAFNSGLIYNMDEGDNKFSLTSNGNILVSDGFTRDFLGVGGIVRSMHGGGISHGDDDDDDNDNDNDDHIDMIRCLDPNVKSIECSNTAYSATCASLHTIRE